LNRTSHRLAIVAFVLLAAGCSSAPPGAPAATPRPTVKFETPVVRFVVPLKPQGRGLAALAVSDQGAWVVGAGRTSGTLTSINAAGEKTGVSSVGWAPSDVAVENREIWVVNSVGDGTVRKGNQNSVAKIASGDEADLSIEVTEPRALAIGADAVWVVARADGIQAFARRDGKPLDAPKAKHPISAVSFAGGRVWLSETAETAAVESFTEGDAAHPTLLALEGKTSIGRVEQDGDGRGWLAAVDAAGLIELLQLSADGSSVARSVSTQVVAKTVPLPDGVAIAWDRAWILSNGSQLDGISLETGAVDATLKIPVKSGAPAFALASTPNALWVLAKDGVVCYATLVRGADRGQGTEKASPVSPPQ
jgi:hypothetical protein